MNINIIFYRTEESECTKIAEPVLRSMMSADDILTIIDFTAERSLSEVMHSVCAQSQCDILLFISQSVVPCRSLIDFIKRKFEDPSVVLAANALISYCFCSARTKDTLGKEYGKILSDFAEDNSSIGNYGNLILTKSLPVLPDSDNIPAFDLDLSPLCAVRRDAYLECGGFDRAFSSTSFMFIDLCRQMRRHGRFAAINDSASYHDFQWKLFIDSSDIQSDIIAFLRKYDAPNTFFDMMQWKDYSKASEAMKKVLQDTAAANVADDFTLSENTIYYSFASEKHPNGLCIADRNGQREELELFGLRLPYAPSSFKAAVFSPKWALIPERLLAIIIQEALRTADVVMLDRRIAGMPACDAGGSFELDYPFFFNRYIVEHIGVFDFSKKDDNFIYVRFAKDAFISLEKNISII